MTVTRRTRTLHLALLLVAMLAVGGCSGCRSHDGADPGADAQVVQPGVVPKASSDWGYMGLRITRVHQNQVPQDQAPWHAAGGDWVFLECEVAKFPGVRLLIGCLSRPAEKTASGMDLAWGEVFLAAPGSGDGPAFLEAFAAAFHQPAPPRWGNRPPGRLTGNAAILGTSLSRQPKGGGFVAQPAGSWTATKLFLAAADDEAEVFFNYSIKEGTAEFAEKDGEYRESLVRQFATALRDGPLPERTPANDPNLTLTGPRLTGWKRIAGPGTAYRVLAADRVLFLEALENGSTRLWFADPAHPDVKQEIPACDGSATVSAVAKVAGEPLILISETANAGTKSLPTEAPQRLWLVTPSGKRACPAPSSARRWYATHCALASDGAYIVLHEWLDTEGQARARVLHVGNLANGTWRTVSVPDTVLELTGWNAAGAKGLVFAGEEYDAAKPRKAFWLEPATATLVPADAVPLALQPGRRLSPDGRLLLEIRENDRLRLTLPTGEQPREFLFHPLDRQHAYGDAFRWLTPRYILFDAPRPAIIDSTTLKMNYPMAKADEINDLALSPDFHWALGTKEDGVYLGIVVAP